MLPILDSVYWCLCQFLIHCFIAPTYPSVFCGVKASLCLLAFSFIFSISLSPSATFCIISFSLSSNCKLDRFTNWIVHTQLSFASASMLGSANERFWRDVQGLRRRRKGLTMSCFFVCFLFFFWGLAVGLWSCEQSWQWLSSCSSWLNAWLISAVAFLGFLRCPAFLQQLCFLIRAFWCLVLWTCPLSF